MLLLWLWQGRLADCSTLFTRKSPSCCFQYWTSSVQRPGWQNPQEGISKGNIQHFTILTSLGHLSTLPNYYHCPTTFHSLLSYLPAPSLLHVSGLGTREIVHFSSNVFPNTSSPHQHKSPFYPWTHSNLHTLTLDTYRLDCTLEFLHLNVLLTSISHFWYGRASSRHSTVISAVVYAARGVLVPESLYLDNILIWSPLPLLHTSKTYIPTSLYILIKLIFAVGRRCLHLSTFPLNLLYPLFPLPNKSQVTSHLPPRSPPSSQLNLPHLHFYSKE